MTNSNLTAHPNRRRFLHGAAALGVAGALPAIRTPSAFAADADLPVFELTKAARQELFMSPFEKAMR
jgi:FtsP/CotA-like multicopper oxidase with cupredoxin domain